MTQVDSAVPDVLANFSEDHEKYNGGGKQDVSSDLPHPQVTRDLLAGRIPPRSTPDSCQRQKRKNRWRKQGFPERLYPFPRVLRPAVGFQTEPTLKVGTRDSKCSYYGRCLSSMLRHTFCEEMYWGGGLWCGVKCRLPETDPSVRRR